jgi:hypothetical protein
MVQSVITPKQQQQQQPQQPFSALRTPTAAVAAPLDSDASESEEDDDDDHAQFHAPTVAAPTRTPMAMSAASSSSSSSSTPSAAATASARNYGAPMPLAAFAPVTPTAAPTAPVFAQARVRSVGWRWHSLPSLKCECLNNQTCTLTRHTQPRWRGNQSRRSNASVSTIKHAFQRANATNSFGSSNQAIFFYYISRKNVRILCSTHPLFSTPIILVLLCSRRPRPPRARPA